MFTAYIARVFLHKLRCIHSKCQDIYVIWNTLSSYFCEVELWLTQVQKLNSKVIMWLLRFLSGNSECYLSFWKYPNTEITINSQPTKLLNLIGVSCSQTWISTKMIIMNQIKQYKKYTMMENSIKSCAILSMQNLMVILHIIGENKNLKR